MLSCRFNSAIEGTANASSTAPEANRLSPPDVPMNRKKDRFRTKREYLPPNVFGRCVRKTETKCDSEIRVERRQSFSGFDGIKAGL
jgi:hypothetical protein